MSVSGLCEICQTPGVEHVCDRCGNLVCERHFESETGLCAECTAEIGRPSGSEDENRPDGVDTYRF